MTAPRRVAFGPNGDGFILALLFDESLSSHREFRVELRHTDLSFTASTADGRNALKHFSAELSAVSQTLSGRASLETEDFSLNILAQPLGHLRFEGELRAYQFAQYPTGCMAVRFQQMFDPITIADSIVQLQDVIGLLKP
ncbi:hypothetical protein [Aestuariivirga sp.]|uniref:hypothetical protein n=1 Tax=Aestuariivirga sp. TaxID=2650926 RepID=UPI0039E5C92F